MQPLEHATSALAIYSEKRGDAISRGKPVEGQLGSQYFGFGERSGHKAEEGPETLRRFTRENTHAPCALTVDFRTNPRRCGMHAGKGREGWAQGSVNFVVPTDVRQSTSVGAEDGREETGFATWLAKVVRYALYSETVGIVLRSERAMPPRLAATAGVPAGASAAWWDQIRADIPDLGANDTSISRSTARHINQEASAFTSDSRRRIVRLVLPLTVGDNRLGVLIVEFRFGERIMPDTLLRARALAHLVSIALDHESLTREREEWSVVAEQLHQNNENIEAALMQVVHELRSPLTTMKLGVQIAEHQLRLAREKSTLTDAAPVHFARATAAVTLANQSADTAERMLSDLTDITRIRAGTIEQRPERCDLANIVNEAVAGQRVAWPRRIVHVELPYEAIPVVVDADRVTQVVCNYVTNALKYSPGDQPVEVRMETARGDARVCVCDHGAGIAPEDQRHIWERFYRTNGYNGYSAEGLGVGLFICRQLVEQMGGKVGVESAPGEGSTFWFSIPLAEDE